MRAAVDELEAIVRRMGIAGCYLAARPAGHVLDRAEFRQDLEVVAAALGIESPFTEGRMIARLLDGLDLWIAADRGRREEYRQAFRQFLLGSAAEER